MTTVPHLRLAGPLLDIRGVETYYGNIRALSGVNVSVNEGEIGPNGAGKTTLLNCITGFRPRVD